MTENKLHVSVQLGQSLSHVRLFATPWIAARQASLSITNSRSLLKLMPIESMMPSRHLILCCRILLLPPIPPSTRGFSNESALLMRWPKYWSFSFSISPSKEHPGLISSRMNWLDLLAVQGTLKSLLQHHSSHMCTPIKSAPQLRSCCFVIPSSYNFSQLFPGNHWSVYSPFLLICIYYIFMLIESHTMYSFLSGFLYSAQLFWNSLVLFISTVYHFLLLSAEY